MQDLLAGQSDRLGAPPEVIDAASALVGELPQAALRLRHPYGNVFPNSGRKFRTFIGKSFPAMGLRAEH